MKKIAILLAGGSGERFWPLSRTKKPKQLLPLNTEKPLIVESIQRILTMILPQDTYVFTNHAIWDSLQNILTILPKENIIPEPLKRNTASALAYATSWILAKYGKEFNESEILIGVFTSDHRIAPIDGFRQTVQIAFDCVSKHPKIATIGIFPTRPDTAFGYIEVDNYGIGTDNNIFNVRCFREKPNYDTAKEYLSSGNFYWNSGMFFWRLDTFLNEAKQHMPEICSKIYTFKDLFLKSTSIDKVWNEIESIYIDFPDISIDYALMEKTKNIVLVRSQFDWDDIGSWDALDRTKPHDANNNVTIGNNLLIDTIN
ncbi:MAG: mannose-1-phosphate guanylyltransferase, partial [Candidatus Kapaibacteriota bacterium]